MNRKVSEIDRFTIGRATLRLAILADVGPRYLSWLNDPVVTRYLETRFVHQTLDSIARFVAEQMASPNSYLFVIEDLEHGHVGNIKLGPINNYHRCADVSYFIGERSCWGLGIATDAIRCAAQIGFSRLGLHRVQAGVYAGNNASMRALQKAGFRQEGSWRRQLLGPDGWEDHLWFGLLNEEQENANI